MKIVKNLFETIGSENENSQKKINHSRLQRRLQRAKKFSEILRKRRKLSPTIRYEEVIL
jgi:hypothetical protein